MIECPGCTAVFPNNSHSISLHEEKAYLHSCKQVAVTKRIDKDKATRGHAKAHVWACVYCKKESNSKCALKNHIQRVHVKPFACLFFGCLKKFGTAWDMRQHYRTHFKDLTTDKCNKLHKYQFPEMLTNNVCDFCSRSFFDASGKYALLMHYETHLRGKKQKSFDCGECGKAFTTKSNLSRHFKNFHAKGDNITFSDNVKAHSQLF
ncbi:zinc finger protein [Reticulomyxa filosa]|uniref:Zinc finger protein n=1 Tax=Reticulomyxa filosa TaxID=46433 RepID=X6LUA7_RETFI|nr:zinc finger protein [Reticulomyxa filosa]|eukprot:ETO05498.1 zinc finger protein [Reticulomyxa filosa]